MSARCPEGHLSDATDYCDTCGSPMGAPPAGVVQVGADAAGGTPAGSVAVEPPAVNGAGDEATTVEAAPATQECPHCSARTSPEALFCEACGFDFTTGVMPRPISLAEGSFLDLDTPTPARAETPAGSPDDPPEASAARDEATDGVGDVPASDGGLVPGNDGDDAPADIAASASAAASTPARDDSPATGPAEPGHAPSGRRATTDEPVAADPAPVRSDDTGQTAGDELPVPDRSVADAPAEPAVPAAAPGDEAPANSDRPRRPTFLPPSRQTEDTWVVEVWIDPDWYEVQSTDDPCPSPMVPDVVRLDATTALVGRPSSSRGVRPDIDCGSDTGVSRRQAQLSSDGRRWWIEDLGSANGTFVGPASGPLPTTPLEPGRRVEVDADDRIYVGAWSRLVVRPATASEKAGLG